MAENRMGNSEQRLQESLFSLVRLGESIDGTAAAWLDGSAEALERLAEQMDEAEALIAAAVEAAERLDRLSDEDLLLLKTEWQARFERLTAVVGRQKDRLGGEATDRMSRHRAANAYLKTQSR